MKLRAMVAAGIGGAIAAESVTAFAARPFAPGRRCREYALCAGPARNNLHAPNEVGVDSFQADRSPTHMYRTAPLARL
jgi:hypothetical protein